MRTGAVLLVIVLLAGCGNDALAPVEARPRPAPRGDDRPRVAFCYNQSTTNPRKLAALAHDACGAGFTPRFIADGPNLGACPLLSPARVTFACERDGY